MNCALFSPHAIGPLELANRIVIAPMCQYSAEDGLANDWHMIHLGSLALSGAGLLMTEAAAISPEGRITPHDLGIWSDECQAALGRVVQAIRRHSPIKLAIQLAHAGRKASCTRPWQGGALIDPAQGGWPRIAPSAFSHLDSEPPPHAMDAADLARVRDAFVAAATRAVNLGFDLIELHAAHGYLLHEFLSPLANQRGDEYGGSLHNRMRFPLEIFDAVRAALPAGFPLGVRVSATDWVDGGWDLDECVVFAQALRERGCDFIDVSSGGVSPHQVVPVAPGYQLPHAERIKRETGITTIAVGLITEPAQADAVVASGQADFVALARAMLYDPHWPWHAAAELGTQVHAPPQYWRSQPATLKNLFDTTRAG